MSNLTYHIFNEVCNLAKRQMYFRSCGNETKWRMNISFMEHSGKGFYITMATSHRSVQPEKSTITVQLQRISVMLGFVATFQLFHNHKRISINIENMLSHLHCKFTSHRCRFGLQDVFNYNFSILSQGT